jgi:hypothetical protein
MGVLCLCGCCITTDVEYGFWSLFAVYIHSLRRLDHLETSVMGASLADYSRIQLLSLFRFALSVRTRNLVVPVHRSLAMSQCLVVLGCRAWNMRALFVSAVRRMFCGVDAPN